MTFEAQHPIVLKFGGTSVGSPEALRRAAGIVQREVPQGGVIVVSALSGTTDRILAALDAAARGQSERARELRGELEARHWAVAEALDLTPEVERLWKPLFERLGGLLEGIGLLWEATPRARDAALAIGESLSAPLFTALLQRRGVSASFADVREVMRTDARHGRARVDLEALRTLARNWRARLLAGDRLVTQGFLGATPEGHATTLGRGGSDTSATLLGEALGAEEVQIWTDVDGVLSADPSLVPEARPIPDMSLAEAASLSAFGAKVLHAECLAPVARAGFRLIVANTHRPEASRTLIRREGPNRRAGEITSVAYKEGIRLLRFPGHMALEEVVHLSQRLEEAGAVRYGLLSCPEGTLVALRVETPAAQELLQSLPTGPGEEGWAVVALVGDGLREDPSATLRLLKLLEQESVGGLLTGSSAASVAFLVPEARLSRLVPRLHRHCFPEAQVAPTPEALDLCLVGTGLVGRQVLVQLQQLKERHPERANWVRLVAVANSRKMLTSSSGLDPARAMVDLESGGAAVDLDRIQALGRHGHTVLLDCTSSQAVADRYAAFVEAGFDVVSASKKANSGPLPAYLGLRETLARRGRRFHFETNVGAGLPILGPLRDLQNGGDRVLHLEGILSGSLSFLFGRLEEGQTLSEAVREARDQGFTEPDPREDLSGLDVARKALVLHRELGGRLELADVQVEGVLPADFDLRGEVDPFLERLRQLDGSFRERLQALAQAGKTLRYVAEVGPQGCRVGPRIVDAAHPLYPIKAGENALSFTTEAYQPRPLVVRGYGAGAAVTAAGVLADVLRLVDR